MTNKKSTKRALLMSVLSLLLCCAMLTGTTFAWFTDSVTSGRNTIQSGNLDMKVSFKPYGAENTTWTEVTPEKAIFDDATLYEPGYTEAVWLKIENAGSLAFKYMLNLDVYSETPGVNQAGETFRLSDFLAVKTTTVTDVAGWESFYTTRESLDSFAWGGNNGSVVTSFNNENVVFSNGVAFPKEDKTMAGYDAMYILVVVQMPTTVGNDANHNGKDIPKIELGLNAIATQLAYEEDSFGPDYDEDADYVTYYTTAGEYELNAALKATKATDVITADGEGVVLNITGGSYDAGDQDCAVWAKNGAIVNIYDGTFTHNGDGTEATSAHHYDMIYAGANGGKINIYGGHFSARSEGVWLLNEKDNQGEIVVYGGTFVNWNPANNVSESPAPHSFLAEGYSVISETQANGDVWYTVVATGSASILTTQDDGSLNLDRDIAILDAPVYSNWTTTEPTTINGNGNTITMIASDEQTFDWTDNFTIPLMAMVFSSEDGALVTVNDLTITGTMQSVMAGNYEKTNQGRHNTVFNNVNIVDAQVVSLSANISPALSVYGALEMNNCNVYGATLSPLDTDPMWPVYDMAVVNESRTTVNGGKIGSIITWAKANLVLNKVDVDSITVNGNMNTNSAYGIYINADTTVGTIDLSAITDKTKINITIEDGATVGSIVANGKTYASIADWLNA